VAGADGPLGDEEMQEMNNLLMQLEHLLKIQLKMEEALN
jgi:hypothetical protein